MLNYLSSHCNAEHDQSKLFIVEVNRIRIREDCAIANLPRDDGHNCKLLSIKKVNETFDSSCCQVQAIQECSIGG